MASTFTVTIDGTSYTNTFATTIKCVRPENNVSSLELVLDDYQSHAYTEKIKKFSAVTLQLQHKCDSLKTVFSGEVVALQPDPNNPQTLTVYCEGYERALKQTHSETSWGTESLNPTKDTPREIIQDLADNYVEKTFGGNATNWTINTGNDYVDNIYSGLSLTNLTSKYLDNFTVLNRLLDIVSAYAISQGTPEAGIHWITVPSTTNPQILVKEIDENHDTQPWTKYYGGNQTTASLYQKRDILQFLPHQTIYDYANNIILACALRKPSYDYWTEDAATNSIWTVDLGNGAVADDSTNKVVGADSTKFTTDAGASEYYYFNLPNALNLSYLGSQDLIPTIGFYARREPITSTAHLEIYTTRGVDYFNTIIYSDATGDTTMLPTSGDWYGINIPIGPFYKNWGGADKTTWTETGSPDWTNIVGMQIFFSNGGLEADFWLDDLHISGHIVREARDAGDIDTDSNKERQIFLRLDTAVDDSCSVSDNTGTAARLAAAELFKRSQFKTTNANRGLTATLLTPMKEDLLPGQLLHVYHGQKKDLSYRYNLDMRSKTVTHLVSTDGYLTMSELTSDLWNSHTLNTPSAWGIVQENAGALGHAEARDLKASGVDLNIPRLTWDPTA